MDTPERSKSNQIATSIGKFEDSPIFNFLNSLSPIQPVKSTHITQTINLLRFTSPPSIFTSPHVNSHQESRSLRSHHLTDPSKPEFSSHDDENTVDTTKNVNVNTVVRLDEQKENQDPRALHHEVASEPSFDCLKLVPGFAENYSCDSNSQCSSLKGVGLVGDQNQEITLCDWDRLISDASNLLVFESPNVKDSYENSVDPATSFYKSIKNAIQNVQSLGAVVSGERFQEGSEPENTSTQPGEVAEMVESAGTQDMISHSSMDYERLSGLCRGMKRRCLVYSGSDSPVLQKSKNYSSSNQQLGPKKTKNDSSYVLPRVGLHLNALAATPKDIKIGNDEASSSRELLVGPSPSASFHPLDSGPELLNVTLADFSLDGVIDTFGNGFVANKEINPSSPKKKKRKLEQGGEAGACKRCNCKKSKCLKLYCECFAAGVYCMEPCACIDCFNKPVHEDTILATRKQIETRNPLAFAPKVIRGSDSLSEIWDDFANTPASARHKRGCNCKKSGCLKKYCECYQGGVGCSINCRCEGCKNAFGRKDGPVASCTYPELEEDETDTTEKAALDQCMDFAPSATPFRTRRQSTQPFSSKKKPPRSSYPSICSSSYQHYETIKEDEMAEFLPPINGVNSSSPNSKRVSPPQMPSILRSSRKLILQSIPSFPSLNPNQ